MRLLTVVFAAMAIVACRRGPPERLVPHGAKVVRELPRYDEPCYVHRAWTLTAPSDGVAQWVVANDLPCADDAKPCAHWSTDARKDPFWKKAGGEPQGLDKVDATYGNGQLTVDWGDYTCSGPN
jgi:hypothetical protein